MPAPSSLLTHRLLGCHLRILLLLLQQGQVCLLFGTVHLQLVLHFLDSHALPVAHADHVISGQNDVDGVLLDAF